MKKIFTLLIIALMCAGSAVTYSQGMRLIGVDTQNYPMMKAEFEVEDGDGNSIRNFDPQNDLILTDGGIPREVLNYDCPEGIAKFSMIIVIDRSQSMESTELSPGVTRMDAARNSAIEWVMQLPEDRSECAVIAFSAGKQDPKLIHPFTINKESLKDSIRKIQPIGGTNYNTAFFGNHVYGTPGAFDLAEQAKYKPIIIFITDGEHDWDGPAPFTSKFEAAMVANKADSLEAIVYALTMGVEDGPSINDLKSICNGTGGQLFADLKSETEIINIYWDIINRINPSDYPSPCTVEWETDCDAGLLVLEHLPTSTSSTFTYSVPDSVKPYLEFNPPDPIFLNTDPVAGETKDITVEVTARQNYAYLTGFDSPDSRFEVVGNIPPKIDKDQTINITLRYTPDDSVCHQSDVEMLGTACTGRLIDASAGFIKIRDVDMGNTPVNQDTEQWQEQVICNWTCNDVKIDDIRIEGANAAEFKVVDGSPKGKVIPANGCVRIKMSFKSSEVGRRNAEIVVSALGEDFSGNITGYSVGNSAIDAIQSLSFENVDCQTQMRQQDITINNPGGLPLEISQFELIPNNGDFAFVPANPGAMTIQPGGSETITVAFNKTTRGSKSAVLKIHSNADGNAEYDIDLSGTVDEIDINADAVVDFGVICPGVDETRELNVDNTGTFEVNVAGVIPGPFTIAQPNLTLDAGESLPMPITINAGEGDYEETLVITDLYCNTETMVTVKAKVAAPSVTSAPVTITTTISVPKQEDVIIENNSQRDMTNVSVSSTNPRFTIINQSATNIPAGGNITVTVEYTPVDNNAETTYLVVESDPCDFSDNTSIEVLGNPDKSLATLEISDNYTGIPGEVVPVNIELRNKVQFVESGSQYINFDVSYDPAELAPQNYTPVSPGLLEMRNITFNGTNNNEIIATIDFRVTDDAVPGNSFIFVENGNTDAGNVDFSYNEGLVNIERPSAEIIVKNAQAAPGEEFNIDLYIRDAAGFKSNVNKSISADLVFDATMIEPVGNTPEGIVTTGSRRITVTGMPIIVTTQEKILASYRMRAMLGLKEQTPVTIENVQIENGDADIIMTSGMFTTSKLCRNGDVTRLFDPYGGAALMRISPNPNPGTAEVQYNVIEKGYNELKIVDAIGNTVKTLEAGSMERGERVAEYDLSQLNSGVYFLILSGPTEVYTRQFSIVK